MKIRKYAVEITGQMPLLMANDNLPWAEKMAAWGLDPGNKGRSVRGDDRSPAWRWIGALYIRNGAVVIPSDNLRTVLREGGQRCLTGKGKQTFKAQTQSGLLIEEDCWPLLVNGQGIPYAPIQSLIGEDDFQIHELQCQELGFSLFVKRATVGTAKHVRVRPRFDNWSCGGTIVALDDAITKDTLQNILTFAGAYAGMGSWRPSAPKAPGPYGKFTATVRAI